MHPVLRSGKEILFAGLLWSPVTFWVILLHRILTGSEYSDSALLIIPPMVLQLGISIALWFICKSLRFERGGIFNFVSRHLFSIVLINSAWILLTEGYSNILDSSMGTEKWNTLFSNSIPLFVGVGISIYLFSSLLYYLIIANDNIRMKEQEILEQQLFSSRSELSALKSTIHPHFLFNSLNILRPLIDKSPEEANNLITKLSEFLIYSFKYGSRQESTIEDELEHIRNYMSIEKMRLDKRLKTEFTIDKDTLSTPVPPLILLPVIENGIKHGISQLLNGGLLSVKISKGKENIIIEIKNPFEVPDKKPAGGGHGLSNLKKRLSLYYGNRGGLITEREENIFFTRIFIPLPEVSGCPGGAGE
ncbi:MAG: histidine kinase [Acidobacteriota bacterium]